MFYNNALQHWHNMLQQSAASGYPNMSFYRPQPMAPNMAPYYQGVPQMGGPVRPMQSPQRRYYPAKPFRPQYSQPNVPPPLWDVRPQRTAPAWAPGQPIPINIGIRS